MRRQYPDRLDLFLPTLARFFRIAPAILRLHLSVPSCQQSLTSGYGSIGAQSVAVGKVPGLMDIHGGAQTASRGTVEKMAANGYACISINPGAHPLPELKPGDPNTGWGAVEPRRRGIWGVFSPLILIQDHRHHSLPPKHQLVSRHDCRPPREQGYANVQGLQAIQYYEMEGPVGRFTAPTPDAIRQALRKANRRNSGFHARSCWSGKVA
jgi:hypothetical protein